MTATWTAPKTMTNEPTIYSDWNTYVRDNEEYLKAQVSAEIYISAAGMKPTTSNGCAMLATTETANKQNFQYLAFDAGSVEHANTVYFHMPSDYNGGTFSVSLDWTHPTGTAFVSSWYVRAVAYADNQALNTAWGSSQFLSDTGGTSNIYTTPQSGGITAGGSPSAGCGMMLDVARWGTAAADTLNVDAWLLGMKIYYTRS